MITSSQDIRSCIISLPSSSLHHRSLTEFSMRGRANQGVGRRRGDKREREGERTLGSPSILGAHKDGPAPPLCLPLYLTYSPLFIAIFKDSRPLVLHTDKPPHRRPPWLVAKHCCMLNGKMQTRLTPLPPREASSQLENTTMHDMRRLINATDQRLFTPMSPTHTSIVSKVYGESESSLVFYSCFAHVVNP